MTPATLNLVSSYTRLGWDFSRTHWVGPNQREYTSWIYRSPRMTTNGSLAEDFDDQTLLRTEALHYVNQLYGARIAIQYSASQQDLLAQLAKQQLLVDQHKVGAALPVDVVVTFTVTL